MILYHVTLKVDKDIREEWLTWMEETHIPKVMATGYFKEYRMTYMLFDEPDGYTYSVQYLLDSMEDLEAYMKHEAPALQKDHNEKYQDKVAAYRTLHEVIS